MTGGTDVRSWCPRKGCPDLWVLPAIPGLVPCYCRKMLVVLRGNSGSGKSTIALALQQTLPGPTAILSQDYFRRVVYRERE